MKKKKLLSKANLPSDLWPEILSRLPVKSLSRFLCISKSWLSLIKDPDFCRLHLKRFKNNRDETHLLVVQGTQQNFVLRQSDTLKSEQALEIDDEIWQVSCSIDGLVLLKSCNRQSEFRVWNPSIRKFHKIPPLPEIQESLKESEIGIGYDPLIKDYKHFKFLFVDEKTLHSVAVYTLGADSWKIIPFQGKGFSKWHWNRQENMMSVYLRGSLYFLVTDFKRGVTKLASVDLSSEVFSCISLPRPDDGGGLSGPITLVDDGSTLALFDFWRKTNLWVLESTSWTLRYTIYLSVPKLLYHKKNGDLVVSGDEGNEKSVTIATVDESQARKYLTQRKCLGLKIYNVYGYVESLIMLR